MVTQIQYVTRRMRHHSTLDIPIPTIIPVAGVRASATANQLYWTERARPGRTGLDNLSEPVRGPIRGTHWDKQGSTRLFPFG